MSVEFLQQHYNEIIKQREESLYQIELKYSDYIQTLLQQKLLIIAQITRKYEQLITNINNSIHNKISTNINDFIGSQIVSVMDISNNSQQKTADTPESLLTDMNINNEHNIQTHSENKPIKTITDSNHNQSPNFIPTLPSWSDTHSKRPSRKFRLTFKNKNNNPSKKKKNRSRIRNKIKSNSSKQRSKNNNNSLTKRCSQRLQFKNSSNSKLNLLTKYECHQCDISFSCQKNLTKHITMCHISLVKDMNINSEHNIPIKTITDSNLKTHINQIHRNNGKYACKYCPKRFTRPTYLVTHTRTHTKEKPFKCIQCNKSFAQDCTLKTHINQIHTNNGKYACKYCEKRFTLPSKLVMHTRIHTNEKPFKCNECNKSFAQKGSLKKHKRIHTGEKPFSCNKCGEKFRHSSGRNRHQKKRCKAK